MSQISHKPEKKERRGREREKKWGREGMRQVPLILNACKRSSDSHPPLRFTQTLFFFPAGGLLELTWWSLRYHSDSATPNLNDGWFQTVECFSTSRALSMMLVFQVTSPSLALFKTLHQQTIVHLSLATLSPSRELISWRALTSS